MGICMDIQKNQPHRRYYHASYVCGLYGVYLHAVKEINFLTQTVKNSKNKGSYMQNPFTLTFGKSPLEPVERPVQTNEIVDACTADEADGRQLQQR